MLSLEKYIQAEQERKKFLETLDSLRKWVNDWNRISDSLNIILATIIKKIIMKFPLK